MPLRFINKFLHGQYSSSIVLIFATALAMFLANSIFAESYQSIMQMHVGIKTDFLNLDLSVAHWVNDGLMVLFFLLVGLEIKREFLHGELGTLSKAAFPIICAVGGVIAPALIFLFINKGHHEHWQGWAIPTATDIAFALGLLALGGKNVPLSLKVFLTALAIIDDLIAIIIIALFYGEPLNIDAFFVSVVVMFVLLAFNILRIKQIWPYLVMGFFLWISILQSGLHPTIAGVQIPPHLHEQYPKEMTIVLQYQYYGLVVTETGFSVTLSFNNIKERLTIPFGAITTFADPSVNFALQFQTMEDGDEDDAFDDDSANEEVKKSSAAKDDGEKGVVISLDQFRKKNATETKE